MADDWFRKTSWMDADRASFYERLGRARVDGRGQYLRIQADHLWESGLYEDALLLLGELLEKYPRPFELAQAHLQTARCLSALGRLPEAAEAYRSALRAEDEYPNVQTGAWIEFGWFALAHRASGLYDEVSGILTRADRSPDFPVERYRIHTVHSLIAEERGNTRLAREHARAALAAAAESHSGLHHHPKLGLVDEMDPEIHGRLIALAG